MIPRPFVMSMPRASCHPRTAGASRRTMRRANRVEAAIEERLAARLQLVHRVVDVGDDRPDLVRQLPLELRDHGPQQGALVTKVMVNGALGHPGPRHDLIDRDRGIAALAEEGARRSEKRARSVSGARGLPTLASHTGSL